MTSCFCLLLVSTLIILIIKAAIDASSYFVILLEENMQTKKKKKKKKREEEEKFWANKQLLDEVEYNILDYQNRDLSCLLDPKDEEDNADTDITFNKSWLHTKNEFNNFLIK